MFKRKGRFVIKLFKDAKQVNTDEFLVRGEWPPLNFSVTAETSWNDGGEVTFTFGRKDIELFDEVWLGYYDGCGNLLQEWELCEVKTLSVESNYDDETTLICEFKHMRRRIAGDKWENWSVI